MSKISDDPGILEEEIRELQARLANPPLGMSPAQKGAAIRSINKRKQKIRMLHKTNANAQKIIDRESPESTGSSKGRRPGRGGVRSSSVRFRRRCGGFNGKR